MRSPGKATSICFVSIVISAALLFALDDDYNKVAFPGVIAINIALILGVKLWEREKALPVFDAGMWCVVTTLLYTIVPLVNYIAGGLRFGPMSDGRLIMYQPSPEELGSFNWRHVLYLLFLSVAYYYSRGKGSANRVQVSQIRGIEVHVVVAFFVILYLYFIFLEAVSGFAFNVSYETVRRAFKTGDIADVPLFVRQISHYLHEMFFVLKLLLLMIVVHRCKYFKWRLVLYAWVAGEIIWSLYVMGARTHTVLFIAASAILYHRLVRPLKAAFVVPAGALVLWGFFWYGVIRGAEDRHSLENINVLESSNEFQSILGTSYDVYQMKNKGSLEIPWYVYVNDIINLFPPQQFLPFEKIAASEWYLRTIRASGKGAGYMWGVITQAIVGLDWIEIVLRGALLGLILGRVHAWYLRDPTSPYKTLFYLWLCLKVYYTFRDTTLSPAISVLYEVGPVILTVKYGPKLIMRKSWR